jgi:hypothetical protein
VPSLGNLKPPELTEASKRIDDAAATGGRDPATIRRVLNVWTNLSADDFAVLALEYGFDTFVVGGFPDEPDGLKRFLEEVAPRVRGLVAEGRESR